jgi:hypothetical protein
MITFREKSYSEYDAMRELYNELNRYGSVDNKRFEVISKSYLPGILKGNSVVVEKFTSVTKVFGMDRYRMYIRVGSKAKMPDEVRMPKTYYDETLGGLSLNLSTGNVNVTSIGSGGGNEKQFSNNKNKQPQGLKLSIQNTVSKLLGDAIVYNKKERKLVLELDSVKDAAQALNVLPFGLGYKIYLLD